MKSTAATLAALALTSGADAATPSVVANLMDSLVSGEQQDVPLDAVTDAVVTALAG